MFDLPTFEVPTDTTPIDNAISRVELAFYADKARESEKFDCLLYSARRFNIHPDYIYAIAIKEAGTTGKWSTNRDQTRDFGLMQINYETWGAEFERRGIYVNWAAVLHDQCSNIQVATKIIQFRQSTSKYVLTALANYHWMHSYKKNPKPHFVYKKDLKRVLGNIQREKNRFVQRLQRLMESRG